MRAQPLHLGHESILQNMLDSCEHNILLLGSAQESGTASNPYDIATRTKMIKNSFKDHPNFKNLHIMGIPDLGNPPLWAQHVMDFTKKNFPNLPIPQAYFAGSEDTTLFEPHFKNIEVFYRNNPNLPFISASLIREKLNNNDNSWKELVNKKNHTIIKTNFTNGRKDMKLEKTWNKITTEIKDYCNKYGFTGVTFGLSGGMDSAIIAAAAADALGAQNVHVYMLSTSNTSDLSKDLAQEMADTLGLDFKEINIMPIYNAYKDALGKKVSNPVTFENLQSRIRGDIVMHHSNDNPWLALCCGNKSEASMGYCTLYGDTCGGIAPIGDLYKTEVYALANWRNKQSPAIPQGIIDRKPSAELSPGQKDEDSLPPYEILDPILYLMIEEKRTPKEIASLGFDEDTIDWVNKQFKKTQFKRDQSPPAIELRSILNQERSKTIIKEKTRA